MEPPIGPVVRPDLAARFPLILTSEGSVRARARLNENLDPRVVVGEHGWWQGCPELGVPGYDPFEPTGANLNLLIDTAARDPVSGTAAHKSYLCEIRAVAQRTDVPPGALSVR